MPSRRELPRNFEPDEDDECEPNPTYAHEGYARYRPSGSYVGHADMRPRTEWEALMVAEPHSEPDISRDERLELRDVISDALDLLSEEQRWIFDAYFVRRLSLRELGTELNIPQTTVARKRDALLKLLRQKLEVDPQIQEYLA